MTVKVGVIGVGYLGQHHARIYSQLDTATLVGIFDADAGRAGEIASQHGCTAYDALDSLIRDADALSIAAPTPLHFDIAMKCLHHGKDVLVEKPITVTLQEADTLINEAARRNCILQVGHLERFNPAVLRAEGLLTHPVFFEAERISPFLERAAGMDITLDLMIHDIDIILSLANSKPVRVKAVGTSVLSPMLDVAKAWIDFENGMAALISASRLSQEKIRRLKIFQKDSHIVLDYQHAQIKRHYRSGPMEILHEVIEPEKKEPLMEELRDFIRCVRTRSRPLVSGLEAREALSIALEITDQLKRSGS
ncbi:MAG: Gfo/Idh/MocA family oxidoreductase [bacterium]